MDHQQYYDGTNSALLRRNNNDDDDDVTTVHDFSVVSDNMEEREINRRSMLEHGDDGDVSCQGRELQLPSSSKNVYEAWTLIYRRPNRRLQGWTKFLWYKFRKTVRTEPGKVLALNPKVHFEQEELSDVINQAKVQYRPRSNRRTSGTSATYDEDVERRLRTLEIPVQDELYKLLRDRAEHASNSYRRREYKLVVLLEVPGGEMTDAGTGPQAVNKNKNKRTLRDVWKGKAAVQAPHVEYRVILRGSEVKTNAAGWGIYNRYAQPWRLADEIDVINAREKSGYQELLG